jgi:hypothetical protein
LGILTSTDPLDADAFSQVGQNMKQIPCLAPALWALSLVAGCQSSNQPGSMGHASVQIQGRSVQDIQQTTPQKDLGSKTASLVSAMKTYDPDHTWSVPPD